MKAKLRRKTSETFWDFKEDKMVKLVNSTVRTLVGNTYKNSLRLNRRVSGMFSCISTFINTSAYTSGTGVLAILYSPQNTELIRWQRNITLSPNGSYSLDCYTSNFSLIPNGINRLVIFVNGHKVRTLPITVY